MRGRGSGAAMLIAFGLGAAGWGAAAEARAPDAHMIPRPRGDVLVVEGGRTHVGYVPPYARWRYVAVAPGMRVRPAVYARRYVVDPGRGFAAARGSYRWIRYADDLLLVDTRNGRVSKVAAGHFATARRR